MSSNALVLALAYFANDILDKTPQDRKIGFVLSNSANEISYLATWSIKRGSRLLSQF